MKLLYGKPVADEILARLKGEISSGTQKPGLAAVLVGNDEASQLYVNLKEKKARKVGMNFFRHDLPEQTPEGEILTLLEKLNGDSLVHGIIVQLPLPEGLDTEKIIASIDPSKDADGFHHQNTEKFLQGIGSIWPVFPRAIVKLLESSGEKLAGKKAVIIANSHDFGKIMQASLEREELLAEYFLADDLSASLEKVKAADVIVSAVGRPSLLKGEMLKEDVVIIDGGISKVAAQVFGDVDFASTGKLSGFITPVPGGVGPVTIACLLENVHLAFKAQQR